MLVSMWLTFISDKYSVFSIFIHFPSWSIEWNIMLSERKTNRRAGAYKYNRLYIYIFKAIIEGILCMLCIYQVVYKSWVFIILKTGVVFLSAILVCFYFGNNFHNKVEDVKFHNVR